MNKLTHSVSQLQLTHSKTQHMLNNNTEQQQQQLTHQQQQQLTHQQQQLKHHHLSLGAISPKDALALQYFPSSNRTVSGPSTSLLNLPFTQSSAKSSSPTPFEHRRTFSASSPLPPILSPKSTKRLTWTNPKSPLPTTALTEEEIKGIEQLGVKFLIAPTPSTSPNPAPSPKLPTLIRPTIRRNSIINPKRRRSIKIQSNTPHHISSSSNRLSNTHPDSLKPLPISANQLLDLFVSQSANDQVNENLLIIDLRPLNSYLGPNGRLKGSINVNFPSLLIKRFLKGTPSNFQFHPFITTEAGKRYYSRLENTYNSSNLTTSNSSSSVLEQLDICVIDDQLDEQVDIQKNNNKSYHPAHQTSFGKILLDVLGKLFHQKGRTAGLFYLSDPFEELLKAPAAQKWLLFGEQSNQARQDNTNPLDISTHSTNDSTITSNTQSTPHTSSAPHGLLRLHPSAPTPSLPSIDQDSTPSITCSSSEPSKEDPHSPTLPISNGIVSSSVGHKPKPPKLRKIDTSRLSLGSPRQSNFHPKQSLALLKTDLQTLSVSPKMMSDGIAIHSNLHPQHSLSSLSPLSDFPTSELNVVDKADHRFPTSQYIGSQPTGSELGNGNDRRASSSPTNPLEMNFQVSTIIPSFLYLGPEPSKESDFKELKKLGIKVILNVALECQEPTEIIKGEIESQEKFIEKYYKIPLRDFVEETGIQAGIKRSNEILNHAFLLQFPTYVHCKAGKSRSVTIVLAYLIHRYRWNLKQSYAHVSERRKGVCPNIGFLAELMNFEEREIGSKSRGAIRSTGYKPGRSASHHYSHSIQHTPQLQREEEDIKEKERVEEEEGARFLGYSMNSRLDPSSSRHHPTSNSFDPCRHHGFRVRSVALGSKTDFFSSLVNPTSPSTNHNAGDNDHNKEDTLETHDKDLLMDNSDLNLALGSNNKSALLASSFLFKPI